MVAPAAVGFAGILRCSQRAFPAKKKTAKERQPSCKEQMVTVLNKWIPT